MHIPCDYIFKYGKPNNSNKENTIHIYQYIRHLLNNTKETIDLFLEASFKVDTFMENNNEYKFRISGLSILTGDIEKYGEIRERTSMKNIIELFLNNDHDTIKNIIFCLLHTESTLQTINIYVKKNSSDNKITKLLETLNEKHKKINETTWISDMLEYARCLKIFNDEFFAIQKIYLSRTSK